MTKDKKKIIEDKNYDNYVCIYCGLDVDAEKCPRCGRYTELNPGFFGQQVEFLDS